MARSDLGKIRFRTTGAIEKVNWMRQFWLKFNFNMKRRHFIKIGSTVAMTAPFLLNTLIFNNLNPN